MDELPCEAQGAETKSANGWRVAQDGECEMGIPIAAGVSLSDSYLERQATIESNARAYPRRLPIVLASGRGVTVRDVDGREYIDCLAGAGALALGHGHPVVVEAIRKALEEGAPLQTLDLPTPLKDDFTRTLFDSLPRAFATDYKIHFCGPTGADAVEAALKLAKTATGRKGLLAFHGAYHGMTQGAMSVTGETSPKLAMEGRAGDVQFLPFPIEYRCPFGMGAQASADISARFLATALEDPNSGLLPPAAVILEVVQGEGGINPAPDEWLRKVREITTRHEVLLIVDEVQTGIGRTGRLFAFEHAGVAPDVIVLSKAIGGGLPLAVILYRRELDVWRPGAHAGTFRGNQLAFAAGAATVRHVVSTHLERQAEAVGDKLQSLLSEVAKESDWIGHVRGRGLMRGVEISDPRSSESSPGSNGDSAASAMSRRIQDECLRRGLIIELGGRFNVVVRFLPPLIATLGDVEEIAGRFSEAVKAAERADVSRA